MLRNDAQRSSSWTSRGFMLKVHYNEGLGLIA